MTEQIVFDQVPEFYMMATKAIHIMGLSRATPSLCKIYGENEKNWVGKWVEESQDFFNIGFPKSSTRRLIPEEIEFWEKKLNIKIIYHEKELILNTRQIAEKWLNSFNEHNLEVLLSLYDKDAVHYSPRLKDDSNPTGHIKGKRLLREWWGNAFSLFPTLRYELIRLSPNDNWVIIEYNRTVSGQKDMYVAEFLRIKAGLIIESRVYLG